MHNAIQKRNGCLFFRVDTETGLHREPVCEKLGHAAPDLKDCDHCTVFRSCLDEKERERDARRRHIAGLTQTFHRTCRSCGSYFSTRDIAMMHCTDYCAHSRNYARLEGR